SLRQPLYLSGHAIRNRLPGGVVFCTVDTQAGGQTLDSLAKSILRLIQIVLGNQSQVVGVDNRHVLLLRERLRQRPPLNQGSPLGMESWPFTGRVGPALYFLYMLI